MKKLLIPALGFICAASVLANEKNVPSQLQGSWCHIYSSGHTERVHVSKTNITHTAEEYYEGKILSIENHNGTYLLKTKGKIEAFDGETPYSQHYKVKRTGKALLINGRKYTQCR